MTLVGKIFTALIILVATPALIWLTVMVFRTHKAWKAAVKNERTDGGMRLGLEPQLANTKSRMEELRSDKYREIETLAVERAAARERMADLESQIVQLEHQVAQRAAEELTLKANQGRNEKILQTADATLKELSGELQSAVAFLQQTRGDYDYQINRFVEAQAETTKAELEQHALKFGRREVERDQGVQQLAQDAVAYQAVLDKIGASVHTDLENSPPSLVGRITRVKNNQLVEISLGSDSGLQIGHQLSVSRNRSYLGQIVVRETYPERAVAEMRKDYRRGQIMRGDRVATTRN